MSICYLYHICRKGDEGNLTKGYIGISKNPKNRLYQHKAMNRNAHLHNALKKYSDIVMSLITEGSRQAMLQFETYLRPSVNIGWNIASGGGDAPDCTGRVWAKSDRAAISERQMGSNNHRYGKTLSESHRETLSRVNSGSGNTNHGGLRARAVCEYCGIEDASVHIGRWHGEFCKKNPNRVVKPKQSYAVKELTCNHCGKTGKGSNMPRYHFDNCKLKPEGQS